MIAKVGKWPHSREVLTREHAVAAVLAAAGAEVARPLLGAVPTRDEETGFVVTLWERVDHDSVDVISPADVGRSLRRLHEALAHYEGELPDFEVAVQQARDAVADERMPAVPGREDRLLIADTFERLIPRVDAYVFTEQPLHGEPHLGNVLSPTAGLRWIDLEGVCVGPQEWDLAFLPDEAATAFADVDRELLRLLRTLNSARVATWCWLRAEFEVMRQHGEYHLEQLRRSEFR